MTDTSELVAQALAELADLVRCTCSPAFTDRGLHDPACNCRDAEALAVVTTRIEALEAENAKLQQEIAGLYEDLAGESI